VPPIAYKMHSLNDLNEIALVKTAHILTWFQKTSVLVLRGSDKKSSFQFQFGNRHSTSSKETDFYRSTIESTAY